MTIGIAAAGPNAGLAVFQALRAAEAVASGAIGGFASFAVITAGGELIRAYTQRGGSRTLFLDGERTGVEPPPAVAAAPVAAVMSSGPDRPVPLAQFVAGDGASGLVTGHRLPNRPGADDPGIALNQRALAQMGAGLTPQAAVDAVLDANPQADAGLIAVNIQGQLYARNSDRVDQRPDLGHARRERNGSVVEVLHNAVTPGPSIAQLAAETALEAMRPRFHPDAWLTLRAGIPVRLAEHNAVLVDDDGVAYAVLTTDPELLTGPQGGAALYIGSTVIQRQRPIGHTFTEPYVVLDDGVIVSLSGQQEITVGFRYCG